MSETDATADKPVKDPAKGFLAWVERTGNKLPDPVFIFFYLIVFLLVISVVCALFGLSAKHPTQLNACLLYTSPSPRDLSTSRMPSSA